MTAYMMKDSKSNESTKMAPIKKFQVRIKKYLMCIYQRHRCISVPNMKILCLNLWLVEVCTDYANDDDANDDT